MVDEVQPKDGGDGESRLIYESPCTINADSRQKSDWITTLNRIGDRFNVRTAKRLWLLNGFTSASKAECKGDVADDGMTS